jgi:hypothetical protein
LLERGLEGRKATEGATSPDRDRFGILSHGLTTECKKEKRGEP